MTEEEQKELEQLLTQLSGHAKDTASWKNKENKAIRSQMLDRLTILVDKIKSQVKNEQHTIKAKYRY